MQGIGALVVLVVALWGLDVAQAPYPGICASIDQVGSRASLLIWLALKYAPAEPCLSAFVLEPLCAGCLYQFAVRTE